MKAAVYHDFRGPVAVETVPDPDCASHGVVLDVKATGICRSDWHGWMGHDQAIVLPHVPGHEIAGVVVATGPDVKHWHTGDRVTLPFVCGCGDCAQCLSGNHQVCDHQSQPGFTHWGAYAQYVAIDYADVNLVRLPDEMSFVTAASLGCRFATAFRGVTVQGRVAAGDWVAVLGCGGVGLSAVMIATALGAKVVAVDVSVAALNRAIELGAVAGVAAHEGATVSAVREASGGGVNVSIDALGSAQTCFDAIASLRKRGRHVQIGLLTGQQRHPAIPMDLVVANEFEIVGSHGMQAHAYPAMLGMINSGQLAPEQLLGRTVDLADAARMLCSGDHYDGSGIHVIDRFS